MPDEKLYAAGVAQHLGVTVDTWRGYCSTSGGRNRQAPEPDGMEPDRGHYRPWWWKSTIVKWNANRPGPGARTDIAKRQEPPATKRQPRKRASGKTRGAAVPSS